MQKWRTLRQPYSYSLSDELQRALDAELRKGYDILQLEQLWSGYLAAGRERVLTSVHHFELLDLAGVWHPSWRFLMSKSLMCYAEKKLLPRLQHLRTTTQRLAKTAAAFNPTASVHTVPIALEPSIFGFTVEDRTSEPTIGFVGSMNWSPGYLAAERMITRVFPRVRVRRPDARLLLVGWNAWQVLARHLDTPGVEIIANVPDARPYFHSLQVFTYPTPQGSGMKVKILEAMASGIPVVTTTEGIEGVCVEDGVHAYVTDDDELLAERIVQLLDDSALRRKLRHQARQLIEEHYAPKPTAAALERVYQTL